MDKLYITQRCHYCLKQKQCQSQFIPLEKKRKRIKTILFQLNDQFIMLRYYENNTNELNARIVDKISKVYLHTYFINLI